MSFKSIAIWAAVVLFLLVVGGTFGGCHPLAWISPSIDNAMSMRTQSAEYAKQTRALERIATSLESIDSKLNGAK